MSQTSDGRSTSDSQVSPLEVGLLNLQLSTLVNIDYDDGRNADVPVIDLLRKLLIVEKRSLVIIGEGNFTFSVAIAAMRGSWDGITATRYPPVHEQDNPEPQFAEVELENITYCISNGKLFINEDPSMIVQNIHKITLLPSPGADTWRFGVDGTNLPTNLRVQNTIVWFQCPWSTGDSEETGPLLLEFLEHMSSNQSSGDYVLIGIIYHFFPICEELSTPAFAW